MIVVQKLRMIFFVIWLAPLAWIAYLVRPIADDYCNFSLSKKGILHATKYQFQNWDGNIVSMASNAAIAGRPLNLFGFEHGGGVSLLLTNLIFIILLGYISYAISDNKNDRYTIFLYILPTWFIFWQVDNFLNYSTEPVRADFFRQTSFGILSWQTLNSQYFVITFTTIIVLLLKEKYIKNTDNYSNSFINYFLTIIIGISIGLTEYILILTVATFYAYLYIKKRDRLNLVFVTSLLLGFLISMSAPGTIARSKLLNPNDSLKYNLHFLKETLFSTYFNFGALLTFICSVFMFLSISQKSLDKLTRWILKFKFEILGTNMIVLIFSCLGMYKAGWSSWRTTFMREVFFS